MRHYLFICIAMLGLGLAGAWLSLGHEPPTRLAVNQGDDPVAAAITPTSTQEPEVTGPPPAPAAETSPATRKNPGQSAPDLNGGPATLEDRWQELRRQGRWNEAAPLWEEIKAKREAEARRDNPIAAEPSGQPQDVGDPEKGGYAPAAPPRLDMLPGPLPSEQVKRTLERMRAGGSLRIALVCPNRHLGNQSVSVRFFDKDGKQLTLRVAVSNNEGIVEFENVPSAATAFELFGDHYEDTIRESCQIRPGEQTDVGRVTLTPRRDND